VKSLDTNVLVRYYAQDDTEQSAAAYRVMVEEPALFATKTVLLELFWVLTKAPAYAFRQDKSLFVVRHLISLPNVTVEDYAAVDTALRWSVSGIEFPDALHLASSRHCLEMLTFDDKRFAKRVSKAGIVPACRIPA
jgi:predicted nucleic-acid-binding protein